MKSKYLFLIIMVLGIFLLKGEERVLRVGVFANKPLSFVKDSQGLGIYPDILKEIAQRENWKLVFVLGTWAEGLQRLKDGKIHLMVSVTISKERRKVFQFSRENVIHLWGQVYTPKKNEVQNIFDLQGKRVALMRKDINAYNFRRLCQKFQVKCEFVEVPLYKDVCEAMARGKVDAGVINNINGAFLRGTYNIYPSTVIFDPINPKFATSKKENAEVLATIDSYIREWKKDENSVYYAILDHWYQNRRPPFPYASIFHILCIALLALCILYGWNRMLRREVKRRTSELAKSETRFREMFDQSPYAILLVDQSNNLIRGGNNEVLETLGYRSEEMREKDYNEFHPHGKGGYLKKQQNTIPIETEFINSEGRIVPVELVFGSLANTSGSSWVVFFRDITEKLQAQKKQALLTEELRQSKKMDAIGQLAGGIAHDFNNQLQGIMGYADLLVQTLQDPELKSYAEMILQTSCRSADLTNQLLAFARKGKHLSVPVNLHELIIEVIALLERSIDKKIQIHHEFTATNANVIGDPTQLQNTLLNIGINARDAMHSGGDLTFRTKLILSSEYIFPSLEEKKSFLQVSITDTGIGIDQETREKIFEPFFTTKESGTGMGLAAVYGVVSNHSGYIVVNSEVGQGTTFEIYLPITEKKAEPQKIASSSSAKMKRLESDIIIIDDEEIVLQVGRKMLEKIGCPALTFTCPVLALDFIEANYRSIHIIIVDVVMPKLSLNEFLNRLQKVPHQIEIIAASGYKIEDQAEYRRLGVCSFLAKPFRFRDLESIVLEKFYSSPHNPKR